MHQVTVKMLRCVLIMFMGNATLLQAMEHKTLAAAVESKKRHERDSSSDGSSGSSMSQGSAKRQKTGGKEAKAAEAEHELGSPYENKMRAALAMQTLLGDGIELPVDLTDLAAAYVGRTVSDGSRATLLDNNLKRQFLPMLLDTAAQAVFTQVQDCKLAVNRSALYAVNVYKKEVQVMCILPYNQTTMQKQEICRFPAEWLENENAYTSRKEPAHFAFINDAATRLLVDLKLFALDAATKKAKLIKDFTKDSLNNYWHTQIVMSSDGRYCLGFGDNVMTATSKHSQFRRKDGSTDGQLSIFSLEDGTRLVEFVTLNATRSLYDVQGDTLVMVEPSSKTVKVIDFAAACAEYAKTKKPVMLVEKTPYLMAQGQVKGLVPAQYIVLDAAGNKIVLAGIEGTVQHVAYDSKAQSVALAKSYCGPSLVNNARYPWNLQGESLDFEPIFGEYSLGTRKPIFDVAPSFPHYTFSNNIDGSLGMLINLKTGGKQFIFPFIDDVLDAQGNKTITAYVWRISTQALPLVEAFSQDIRHKEMVVVCQAIMKRYHDAFGKPVTFTAEEKKAMQDFVHKNPAYEALFYNFIYNISGKAGL